MENVITNIGVSSVDRIRWLEAEEIAKKITSKTGLYAQKIDHFQARIENYLIEKVLLSRIKKGLHLLGDTASAYGYLDALRRDFHSGKKSMFGIVSQSAAESLLDGSVWEGEQASLAYQGRVQKREEPLLLYVTGGGFIMPPSQKQAIMVRRLAKSCGCSVVLGKHRLAPENPFPTACKDIAAQYERILKTTASKRIMVGADTAGASVLLGALQILRDRKKPLPIGVLLFSPWCDLSLSGWSYVTRSLSSVSPFRMESAAFCARLYLEDELATHPLASPVYADFDGFPSLCIHTSEHDIHFDDAVKLAQNAHKANVDVQMNYWDTPRHHLERLKSKDSTHSFALAAKFVEQCLHH